MIIISKKIIKVSLFNVLQAIYNSLDNRDLNQDFPLKTDVLPIKLLSITAKPLTLQPQWKLICCCLSSLYERYKLLYRKSKDDKPSVGRKNNN